MLVFALFCFDELKTFLLIRGCGLSESLFPTLGIGRVTSRLGLAGLLLGGILVYFNLSFLLGFGLLETGL